MCVFFGGGFCTQATLLFTQLSLSHCPGPTLPQNYKQSPRRQYLYLGSVLAAASLGLLVAQLSGLLFGASLLSYSGHLLVGILMFSGWVVYDTQARGVSWERRSWYCAVLRLFGAPHSLGVAEACCCPATCSSLLSARMLDSGTTCGMHWSSLLTRLPFLSAFSRCL